MSPAAPCQAGATPAIFAAFFGHIHILRALAAAGADMELAESNGSTAVTRAEQQGHGHCARWLQRSVGWQPIHFACDSRQGERLPALLRDGADPTVRSTAGETPGDICTLAGEAEGALPEDPATTKLLRLALLPWHPERHHLFPRSFQPRVVLVLLLQQRIERRAVQYAERVGPRRRTRRMRRLEAALNAARAPVDVWLNSVVPFLPRFGAAGRG